LEFDDVGIFLDARTAPSPPKVEQNIVRLGYQLRGHIGGVKKRLEVQVRDLSPGKALAFTP
jgi:hypothetical protein